jgi:signal transduction histidine kinase
MINDLIIVAAYFSIPLQLSVLLYRFIHLSSLPKRVVVVGILFVLFILLCGVGHLLRCLGYGDSSVYVVNNTMTSLVSLATALSLPILCQDGVLDYIKLNEETAESKRRLQTFMAFLCHEIRNPLFAITSSISFLEDDPMTIEQEKGLGVISQSAELVSIEVSRVW